MQFQTIHITDHAIQRWSERTTRQVNIEEITEAIKKSTLINKKDFLPFCLPRKAGTVYSFDGEVLFVFETVSINEFRLVTVITESGFVKPIEPILVQYKIKMSPRECLIKQKLELELQLSEMKLSEKESYESEKESIKDLLNEVEKQLSEIKKNKIQKPNHRKLIY